MVYNAQGSSIVHVVFLRDIIFSQLLPGRRLYHVQKDKNQCLLFSGHKKNKNNSLPWDLIMTDWNELRADKLDPAREG